VTSRSDAELRELYPDLLGDDVGKKRVQLIRDLHAGYGGFVAPAMSPTRQRALLQLPSSVGESLDRLDRARESMPARARRWRLHTRIYAAVGAVAAIGILLATSATVAGPSQPGVTDLGKPVSVLSTNPYFPLSGFRRIPTLLRQQGKPELLFLGAIGQYPMIVAER
jgi:hypothetical protein